MKTRFQITLALMIVLLAVAAVTLFSLTRAPRDQAIMEMEGTTIRP